MSSEISFSERLFKHISDRTDKTDQESYTAVLLKKGKPHILKKIVEESSEVLIAAMQSDKQQTVYELADLYYHINVLMIDMNITPADIKTELSKRMGISGIQEKKSRPT